MRAEGFPLGNPPSGIPPLRLLYMEDYYSFPGNLTWERVNLHTSFKMTWFGIVGLHDCPWFAKADKLADKIVEFNPSVVFHKEMKHRVHWNDYCEKMKELRGWNIVRSPVIFEILVDIDGKLRLIGDINDFCEYAAMFYNIYYDPTTSALNAMALENKNSFGQGYEGQDRGDSSVLNVSIINAPLDMLELLLNQLLSPVRMLPPNTLLNIHIYDAINKDLKRINGLLMEVADMASPLLLKASVHKSLTACLYQCDLCIYAEDLSREKDPTETDRDWLARVETRVVDIVSAMRERRAKIPYCRMLVGGAGPQCHVAEIFHKALDSDEFGPGRIVASGQYIVQAAKNDLSKLGGIPGGSITRMHAWGWPGQVGAWVEVRDAVMRVENAAKGPTSEVPLALVVTNKDYIYKEFSRDFLLIQKKKLAYTIPQAKKTMALTESILTTIQMWLASEDITYMATGRNYFPQASDFSACSASSTVSLVDERGPRGTYPAIMVGVLCPSDSTLPEGTFMVQPAICVQGRWQALGKVSEKTNDRIISEVSRLWEERRKAIYRDGSATHLFPDLEALLMRPETHLSQNEFANYEGEFLGEKHDDYNFFRFRGEAEEEVEEE